MLVTKGRHNQLSRLLELTDSKRRGRVGSHSENSVKVVSGVWGFTSHACSSSSTSITFHFSQVCTTTSPQAIRIQRFNEKVDNQVVIANWSWNYSFDDESNKFSIEVKLTQAWRLSRSTVGIKINISDYCSDSQISNVSVDNFNVFSITGVQSVSDIVDIEQWASRVKTNYSVDSSSLNSFSSSARNVSWLNKKISSNKIWFDIKNVTSKTVPDKRNATKIDDISTALKIIQKLSDQCSYSVDMISWLDVVDCVSSWKE